MECEAATTDTPNVLFICGTPSVLFICCVTYTHGQATERACVLLKPVCLLGARDHKEKKH